MKLTFRIAIAALVTILASFGAVARADNPGRLARDAFLAIEVQPFDRDVVRKAAQDIDVAYRAEPTDAWVMIAISRLFLERGYLRGDRSRLQSYRADDVTAAEHYARRSVEYGPNESMAHVQVARLQIITENFRGAWDTLNKAHQLDSKGFYPWYYRGVVSLKMKDVKRAGEAFEEAERLATMPFQRRWAVDRRKDIAYAQGDVAQVERIYKQLIEMAPSEPHPYGNYALFLRRMKRYDEAVVYYKKAIDIAPYPLAEEQLKQTILLRDAARR